MAESDAIADAGADGRQLIVDSGNNGNSSGSDGIHRDRAQAVVWIDRHRKRRHEHWERTYADLTIQNEETKSR